MTILAELGGTITVTDDGSAYLLGDLEVTDDGFEITLNVDDRAAVAFAQRHQRLGVRVDVNGITLPSREVVRELTIAEDTDSYGDTLTLRLAGERFSPFARGLIGSRAQVDVRFKYGSPGHEFGGLVFSGVIVEPSFDLAPPTAGLVCLDSAGLHAEKRLKDYAVPPNSGRSRLSIGTEMLTLADIPYGSIDLGGNGGIINKPFAPGDPPVLDVLRDFWGILGVEIGFENGLLVAHRFDPNAPAVLELHAGNIIAGVGSVAVPTTLSPNVTGVVSVSFTREELGGKRTFETSRITVGPYARMKAGGSEAERVQVLEEVTTRTTYLGTLDIRTEELTREIYAPLGAGLQIVADVDPPFYVVEPYSGSSYVFPDGTTRAVPLEELRDTRATIRTKDLDADNRVIGTREERYFYHFLRAAIWRVESGVDELVTAFPVPLNDEGDGLEYPREVIGFPSTIGHPSYIGRPDGLTTTEFTLNADGTIAEEKVTERYYSIGEERMRTEDAYGYGVDSVTYTNHADERTGAAGTTWNGLRITTRRYRAIDEDRYEMTESVKDGTKPPTTTTSRMNGALPRPERAEAVSTSQEIRSEVRDLERIALAGEEIENIEHNEYIETGAEAAVYARHLAREAGARILSTEIPIETLAHKWRPVRVNLPGSSIHGLKFFIKKVSRNAATYREGITAAYYSPELS